MKKLFTLILFLLSFIGFSQSGEGYLDYESWQSCNGCSFTFNGNIVYGQIGSKHEFNSWMGVTDNDTKPQAVVIDGNAKTTKLNSGETLAGSTGGFGPDVNSYGGRPTGTSQGERYVVDYWGWFYANQTGSYKFKITSDDSHEFYLDLDGNGTFENAELITKKYNGNGSNTSSKISLTSGTWYKLRVRYHEWTGNDYLIVRYVNPANISSQAWRILGSSAATTAWGDKVTNIDPSTPTFASTVNDGPNAVTYKSFKINDYANNNNQGEYNAHPQSASDFDAMFDYANKNTTTWTHWGRDTATKALTWPWPNILPRTSDNNNFGWIIEGYFVPPTSGTYKFRLNSDDRSDLWFDANDDGTITNTGIGLGNGARDVDITNLTAGVSYKFRVRYEQGVGGANLKLKWKSPEDVAAGADWAFNANSIYSIDADNYVVPFHYDVNYKFRNMDETGFSVNTYYEVSSSEIAKNSNSNTISLDANGEATINSQVDEDLVGQGKYNITATPGNVEWVVIYSPMLTNKYKYRIGLDVREFPSGVDLDDVNNIELLDLVDTDGTSSYLGTPGYANSWATTTSDQYWNNFNYWTWSTIPFSSSNYSSSIRSASGYHALKVELNFTEVTAYKTQYVVFDSPSTSELESTVDDVFTVADVVLAFNELAGGGINGGLKGDFDYNVQYANADVSRDGVFDFNDTQIMIDFLNGGTMFDASYLAAVMSLTEVSDYNSMTSTNWTNYGTTRTMFPLGLVTGTNTYDKSIAVHWKGDVNMSHSHLPSNVQVTSMARNMTISNSSKSIQNQFEVDLDIQKIEDEIMVTLTVPENTKNITGSEFRVGYDNSRVIFDRIESDSDLQSFSAKRSSYVKLGSISTDGSQNLNGGIEYKIYFKETNNLDSFLGLVSILKVELVKKDGTQIGVIVK